MTLSAKTLERHVCTAAAPVQTAYDRAAATALDPLAALAGSPGDAGPHGRGGGACRAPSAGPRWAAEARVFVALDGILARGRAAERWLEVQVSTLRSTWQTRGPQRQAPRREVTDRIVVARATGWDTPGGASVARLQCARGPGGAGAGGGAGR